LADDAPKKKPLPTTTGSIREVAKEYRVAKKKDGDSK
jgi:hypothetical protein